MVISYDPAKNAQNIRKHGLAFDACYAFNWETAITIIDVRKDYGETRYIATGYYTKRLHVVCYVETRDGIRVISFRKANARERVRYEEKIDQ
ncbi:MAG: BrnT family toxin [Alphaproteobacteria bacterium]|nr:BrnT family toxin [Alphaproteobacteria bacterium]